MSKSDSGQDQPLDGGGLLEEGWTDMDGGGGGEFASEHTTVDPALLDRLAALDNLPGSKPMKAPSSGPKEPAQRDRTINLDISDLLAMEEAEAAAQAAAPGPGAGASPVASTPAAAPAPAPAPQPSIQIDSAVAEEVDAEFANEKTQIFIAAMDDEPTRAKLRVVQGGGQQKEYLLARDRVTIGRGTNNDILVPDIAMSRQHCEIRRQPDGSFHLGDLNSGNGTRLNGTRIIEADLFGGDRLEIGNTILEFVITGPGASQPAGQRRITPHPSEAAPPARRSTGSQAPVAAPAMVAPAPAMAPVPLASPGNTVTSVPNYAQAPGGATSTHFVPAMAPAPARSSGLLITALIATFGLLFLSLAVVIGAKIYLDFQSSQSGTVSNKPASQYYTEGVEHVKARDWDKAEEKFTIAADLAREERDFQTRKDAEVQLESVRVEKNNQKALERGKTLVTSGQYPEAIARLSDVRSGSLYEDEASKLLGEARQKYTAELVSDARKRLDARQYDEADKKVALALSVSPDDAEAKALRTRIDELPSEAYTRPREVAANTNGGNTPAPRPQTGGGGGGGGGGAVAVREERKTPDPQATNDQPPKGRETDDDGGGSGSVADFAPGLSMYRGKRYGEAIQYFKNIAASSDGFNQRTAETLARNVASFEKNYQDGSSAYTARNWDQATRTLTIAYKLDKAISGSGYHGAELREKLAESHYQQAREAFNTQNFARAGVNAKKVKAYKPSHAGNLQLLNDLESKGRSMYIDALNRKGSDPTQARRIAKAIVDMLPASSDTHKKAKQLLSEL